MGKQVIESRLPPIVAIVALVFVVYVGSFLALARPYSWFHGQSVVYTYPALNNLRPMRRVAQAVYKPLTYLDVRLRPRRWIWPEPGILELNDQTD